MFHYLRIEIDVGNIRLFHTAVVLREEVLHEAGEGVQLHNSHQAQLWILFAHSVDGGAQFGWRVGKILVRDTVRLLAYQLQTVRRAGERLDGIHELLRGDPYLFACQHRGVHILQVMLAENTQVALCLQGIVGMASDICACFRSNIAQVLVALIVDKVPMGFDEVHKPAESVHILGESGEHVDMVPCNAGENGNMRVVEVELGARVKR